MAKIFAPIARLISRVEKDENGTQLVETAVWIGLITAAVVGTIALIGPKVLNVFENVNAAMVGTGFN
ncbi:MAG TPA: hypothetical protein VD995_03950 [Azospirillum sp.]|nr:hypothetical protein [Azospirillum sp.]